MLAQTEGRFEEESGDTGLFYEKETLRLVDNAHSRQIPIRKLVMAVTPSTLSSENRRLVDAFRLDLKRRGVTLLTHYKIEGYPDASIFNDEGNPFSRNDQVVGPRENLVAISPGGGSGKFSVLLSEMYYALVRGEVPDFVKFETFPIYQLDANHALNLAFEAGTADLKNKVINIESREGETRTSYDKDIENHRLLRRMFTLFGRTEELQHIQDAVDMGINQIVHGITDMEQVIEACRREICARILRYRSEAESGIESLDTVKAVEEILGKFEVIYGVRTAA